VHVASVKLRVVPEIKGLSHSVSRRPYRMAIT
jgi:hypothetical protein